MRLLLCISRFLIEILQIVEQGNQDHGRFHQVFLALQRALR